MLQKPSSSIEIIKSIPLIRLIALLILIAVSFFANASSLKTLYLANYNNDEIDISEFIYVLKDESRQIELETIMSLLEDDKFSPITEFQWKNKFHRPKNNYWYYIKIHNNRDSEFVGYLKTNWSTEQLFYIIEGNSIQEIESTLNKSSTSQELPEIGTISIQFMPNESKTIIIRKTGVNINSRNQILKINPFALSGNKTLYSKYIFVGGLVSFFITLIMIHLSMYIQTRDRAHLFFVISVFFLLMHMLREMGINERSVFLIPQFFLEFKYYLPFTLLTYASHMVFVDCFLNAKDEIPILRRFLKIGLLAMLIWFIIDRILIGTGHRDIAWQLMIALRVILLIFSISLLYIIIKSESELKRYVLIGSALLAFSILIVIIISSFPPVLLFGWLNLIDIISYLGIISWVFSFMLGIGFKGKLQEIKNVTLQEELKTAKFRSTILEESERSKSNLFSKITHNFKTPLTIILNELMEIKHNTHSKDIIRRNSEHLLSLIEQILDVGKINNNKYESSYVRSNIGEFVEQILFPYEKTCKSENRQLHIDIRDKILIADYNPLMFQRVVINLLDNALKFTQERDSINVIVDSEHNGKSWSIVVQDTGNGIPIEQQKEILNLDNSRSNNKNGIGLYIVAEYVKMHGGEIDLNSIPGVGSTFRLVFPVVQKTLDSPIFPAIEQHLESIDPLTLPALENEDLDLVMIVEDHQDLLRQMVKQLSTKYRVITATDGMEALDRVKAFVPQLIISDVMMPNLSGTELVAKLKNHDVYKYIPIILLTAKSGHENLIEGLESGADAYMTKPFDMAELQLRCNNLLELSRDRQASNLYKHLQLNITQSQKEDASGIQFLKKVNEQLKASLANSNYKGHELSHNLQMNHGSLNRRIKLLTGLTLTKYIRKFRMISAHNLILTTDLSLSQICYSTGISDPAYFTKLFKKEFGVLPSELKM